MTAEPPWIVGPVPTQAGYGADEWAATNISLELPEGVMLEWMGPYDRELCSECPRNLQIIVLDWDFETDDEVARHSMAIHWPAALEATVALHTVSGACRNATPVVCTSDGCELER